MRFHLIDRVDAYEPADSVRARKLTSPSEEYWEDQGHGPVMPQPFMLEALCQAGTWLIMITTERRQRAALLSVGSVDFLGDVRPGDVLELEGKVESMNDEVAVLSGRVGGATGGRVMEANGHHVRPHRRRRPRGPRRHRAPPEDARRGSARDGMNRRVADHRSGRRHPGRATTPSTWESLVAGRSGVGPITDFDASTLPGARSRAR